VLTGIAWPQRKRAIERGIVMAALVRDDTEQMECIRIARFLGEHSTMALLGLTNRPV